VRGKHSVPNAINRIDLPVESLGSELHLELLSPEAMILENREAPFFIGLQDSCCRRPGSPSVKTPHPR